MSHDTEDYSKDRSKHIVWKKIVPLAIVVLVLSIPLHINCPKIEWHRCGSIITLLGLLLLTRPYIRHRSSNGMWDKERKEDDASAVPGIVLTVLGTLIWGYGDLVCVAWKTWFCQ